MGKKVITKIRCDVCGKRIHGDYNVLVIKALENAKFYYHPPRLAAINPCGNNVHKVVQALFPKSEVIVSYRYD